MWIASVLMFDATSDRSRSVRSRSRSAMSTSTSARGVLGCALMLDSDPCADDMSGSVSVRLFNAEVTSVVPSSTFVVFKFKSVSSTSVLTADSPTFDPTGVALVLHLILERVLGLVLGLLLERAESGEWRLVLDSGLYGKFTRLHSDSCSCACSGVRGSLGVCRSCDEFAICSDVSRLGAFTTGCRLAFVAYTKQVVRRCFHIRRNLHVGAKRECGEADTSGNDFVLTNPW